MRFTLRQVQAFVAVARTAHFGKAAVELRISQPTLSADLRGLERALGVELVVRSRGGNSLTPAGETILPFSHELLDAAVKLSQAAAGAPEAVRLAASPSILNRVVPDLLAQLAETEARGERTVHIEVIRVDTGEVEEAVASGRADAGIGHHLRMQDGLQRLVLGHDELYVLTGRGVITPGESVHLPDLAERTLMLWPREQNPVYFDALMDVCHERQLTPILGIAAQELGGAHSYLLRSGESYTLVPEDYAIEAPASLAAGPLTEKAWVPLHMVFPTHAAESVRAIIQYIGV